MALAAHLEPALGTASGEPDVSRSHRRIVLLEATGALPSGESADVLIHNISATGVLVESPTPLAVEEHLTIDLPLAGPVAATVVWRSADLFGCRFEEPISHAVLSAAQLRAVARSGVARTGEDEPLAQPHLSEPQSSQPGLNLPGQTLHGRLRELRRESGMTLGQLATRLGVSKPTVWAWEQGKSRPVPDRLDAIAAALGVGREALVPTAPGEELSNLLARCREEIGRLVGTDPERIRIAIEL